MIFNGNRWDQNKLNLASHLFYSDPNYPDPNYHFTLTPIIPNYQGASPRAAVI